MKKIALALAILAITGCATSAVPPSKAMQAPKERLLKYQSDSDGYGSLTVIRDKGMVGGGCYATVYLNGERSAKLDTKEKATFYLPAGEWAVGVNLEGKGLCSYSGDRQERFISLSKTEHKYVRIFTDGDGNMDIRPTTLN
ncbi:hypothetical protein [Klebsiella aerogenes]|uniref:hypothetical protein n=1 Tax=Klebsiella aerogenes TaxID=548 RepID=UPI0005DD834D|nr:hypothetical protein [Klebsiella aerogenes]EKU0353583.1 hypothetical protein [Klebsiella aerogenes]ELA1580323.1 hypothetical protein [Klebsiella aerogenes]ELN9407368.1 hypothetical protein [Klebsiella aerogenes]KJF84348.1 hypothetical protein UA44_00535 [Klebsiella aerogenes]RNT22031.1 hypothetical protein B9Z99_000335 [Klebsiella aerogenes]